MQARPPSHSPLCPRLLRGGPLGSFKKEEKNVMLSALPASQCSTHYREVLHLPCKLLLTPPPREQGQVLISHFKDAGSLMQRG